MSKITVRTGQPSVRLDRAEFERRFRERFVDPAFASLPLDKIAAAAWDAYDGHRKAPHTKAAGPGYADPAYQLSIDWIASRDAIIQAQQHHRDLTPRVLLINGSSRSEHTCPGEVSKTHRLVEIAKETLQKETPYDVEVLDLSRITSEYGRNIHPCKACVSTAMPLCHWPCSCYPNHSLGQVQDWMAEIYPMWVRASGVFVITPVHWYQAPSGLKLMIDRMVCADGGNPDPSSTHGKDPAKAKEIEVKGWDYPQHLSGRAFGLLVHGDAEGADLLRASLTSWLTDLGMTLASTSAALSRYIGYYDLYATSHDTLDHDTALQEEVRNIARSLSGRITQMRAGFCEPDEKLKRPRPK